MKRINWKVLLGAGLVLLSIFVYYFHFLIFHDPHHIFIYLLGDIAFVPIEVLLVTLIIHQLLNIREKKAMLEKLNMLIGTFFSEAGTNLLIFFSDFDPQLDSIKSNFIITDQWTDVDFLNVYKRLKNYEYCVEMKEANIENLRNFLKDKRDFLLRLLENPNLLEHESFTELLRAVFHLAEELASRGEIANLPESDLEHLAGDIRRSYGLLVREWLEYMKHLKDNYPYLFSLAMRTNPFDQKASPIVR